MTAQTITKVLIAEEDLLRNGGASATQTRNGQSVTVTGIFYPYRTSTMADLRANADPTVYTNVLFESSNLGGWFYWNSTSTATDDGEITVAHTGTTTGRWIRMQYLP